MEYQSAIQWYSNIPTGQRLTLDMHSNLLSVNIGKYGNTGDEKIAFLFQTDLHPEYFDSKNTTITEIECCVSRIDGSKFDLISRCVLLDVRDSGRKIVSGDRRHGWIQKDCPHSPWNKKRRTIFA